MSRGPWPFFGLDTALPVAIARGRVMLFRQSPDNSGTFVISGNGRFTLVSLCKAPRLYATPEEVGRNFTGVVSLLRTNPFGGPLSLELWLYTRYGSLRLYRVTNTGLVELGADGNIPCQPAKEGMPVKPAKPVAGKPDPGQRPPGSPARVLPVITPVATASGTEGSPEESPESVSREPAEAGPVVPPEESPASGSWEPVEAEPVVSPEESHGALNRDPAKAVFVESPAGSPSPISREPAVNQPAESLQESHLPVLREADLSTVTGSRPGSTAPAIVGVGVSPSEKDSPGGLP